MTGTGVSDEMTEVMGLQLSKAPANDVTVGVKKAARRGGFFVSCFPEIGLPANQFITPP